jgi:hypothetical protein
VEVSFSDAVPGRVRAEEEELDDPTTTTTKNVNKDDDLDDLPVLHHNKSEKLSNCS